MVPVSMHDVVTYATHVQTSLLCTVEPGNFCIVNFVLHLYYHAAFGKLLTCKGVDVHCGSEN